MRAQPWFGLWRGLLFALWPGMRFEMPATTPPAWQRAAQRRRRMLLALVALLSAVAFFWQTSAPPEVPPFTWMARVALGTLLFAWLGSGFVTALMGAWVMVRGDRHALVSGAAHAPIDASARTAVIMPICNEDVATVFAGLQTTCQSLAATGALSLFDFYVLSDTGDASLRAAEQRAWRQLRETLGDNPVRDGGRVFYRWRRRRTRRKAGNVADFCRRWGAGYRYMVVLDADSIMRGDTLVAMLRLMEHNPRAGIVQTLPEGLRPLTLHARLQQFSSRVTGRLFALGMSYWQLGESHYWGHNAILRVAPFMQHCALAPIPGRGGLSGEILSHDFVEAALMRRAGYEVWLAPQLQGSWEQHPSSLLEELQRDRRWCQGNLQNAKLIAEPGLRAVHRAMLAVGALSYLMAPAWLAFVALGLAFGVAGGLTSGLWVLTLVLLVLPRALGVVAVQMRGEQHLFGGRVRLLGSAALELLLSALQAPVRMLAHSAFVVVALTGLRLDWKSPARAAAHVAWGDALRRVGTLTLPPLALACLPCTGMALVRLIWCHCCCRCCLQCPLQSGPAVRDKGARCNASACWTCSNLRCIAVVTPFGAKLGATLREARSARACRTGTWRCRWLQWPAWRSQPWCCRAWRSAPSCRLRCAWSSSGWPHSAITRQASALRPRCWRKKACPARSDAPHPTSRRA